MSKVRLNPTNSARPYIFFDSHSLNHCTWKTDWMINVSGRLARPVVFLAIDQFATRNNGLENDSRDERADGKPQKPDAPIRHALIYQTALKYAHQRDGCVKIFNAWEDRGSVKPGDVFIYAGPNSEKDSITLKDMADIEILSGREAIDLTKKTSKHVAN